MGSLEDPRNIKSIVFVFAVALFILFAIRQCRRGNYVWAWGGATCVITFLPAANIFFCTGPNTLFKNQGCGGPAGGVF